MTPQDQIPTIESLMTTEVITVTQDAPIQRLRELMTNHSVSSIPVVDEAGELLGIVTSSDLLDGAGRETPAREVMTTRTVSLPVSVGVDEAARVMRKQRIHHVLAVRDKKVIGVISTMDLLELVATHRFVVKNQKSKPRAGSGRRRRSWKGFE